MDNLIEGAATIEGLLKGKDFGIERIGGWIVRLILFVVVLLMACPCARVGPLKWCR